jgi:polyisoprenoid-binding protein YceI
LRSDSWFEVERYPTMTFRSTSFQPLSDTEFVAAGELTIKDTTSEIELPITVLGVMDVPENRRERLGEQVASFQAATVIDRRDFGVGTGSWTETTVVGADVEIEITIEANRR